MVETKRLVSNHPAKNTRILSHDPARQPRDVRAPCGVSRDPLFPPHGRVNLPRGDFGHDGAVSLKLEFIQHLPAPSKPRGAFNTLLSRDSPLPGAFRSGGFGPAIRCAVALRPQPGCPRRVFVPEIARTKPKVDAIRLTMAAGVRIGGPRYADDRHLPRADTWPRPGRSRPCL